MNLMRAYGKIDMSHQVADMQLTSTSAGDSRCQHHWVVVSKLHKAGTDLN